MSEKTKSKLSMSDYDGAAHEKALRNHLNALSNSDFFSAPSNNAAKSTDSLSTKERESMLKIIIGMAIAGFGYDPNAKRSKLTGAELGSIHADLAKHNIYVDPDTIRKYLQEAKRLILPQKS